jgi:hypothetical protein
MEGILDFYKISINQIRVPRWISKPSGGADDYFVLPAAKILRPPGKGRIGNDSWQQDFPNPLLACSSDNG